ncbi:hypothetical protein SPRG_21901 [Saprolegnia parasitica CBS 223.65]|uniref:Uncharacterized protein n=1 Tax=Saprolegnia parasitica (strain CBS 223.65) TaxID=695850 RepID=A0A067BFU3_SAPPC|nr:hypothetical protein SPRG_21901 [Saprolegnia parasitica CBS 223.65]KDO17234.1 hypothetical protein SPRG_21901 [Saprolegnia parasitica CBS 223.65]|eukprot:XP_012212059.1 hypothetical protein SPRG_21901 [Saprolegnia parasitica CBS 223.65]
MASIPSLGGQIDAAPAAVKARQHRHESGAEGRWQPPYRKHQHRVWCKRQQKHRRADKEVGANLVPTRGRWTIQRRGPRRLVDPCVHRGVEGSNDEVDHAPVVSKLRGDRRSDREQS